jgi:hypothetical protein
MPSKSNKKLQGPSLYKTFIDAYMKARPNEKRAVSLINHLINAKQKRIID